MDELADALRMDPVALRMKNYADRATPAAACRGRASTWTSATRWAREMFGWSRRNPVPRSVTDGDWLVGMGMATAVYPADRFRTTVRVRLQADGTASVATATADLGTGMWTVLSIMGADRPRLPLDRIRPDLGDSALPRNTGAFGSSSTASVGPRAARRGGRGHAGADPARRGRRALAACTG